MQTSPVAALAFGTRPGSTNTIDKMRKNSGRIVLVFFKYVHYTVNSNGEIRFLKVTVNTSTITQVAVESTSSDCISRPCGGGHRVH
jgi:hypothetical protein